MNATQAGSDDAGGTARAPTNLEVIVISVSDVDRAKAFYARLGWRLDADVAVGDELRLIQFTPRLRVLDPIRREPDLRPARLGPGFVPDRP